MTTLNRMWIIGLGMIATAALLVWLATRFIEAVVYITTLYSIFLSN